MPSEPLEDDALNAMRDYALGTTPTSPAGVEMSHADAVCQARIMVGWLVAEVDRLRAELRAETEDCQTLQEAYMRAGEDAGNYLLTIETVADLHQEAAGFCCTCEAAVWPCDTARALRHRPRGTPMNEDLTAAEQAAAEALLKCWQTHDETPGPNPECCIPAMVAAARPIIEAEALDEAAEALDEAATLAGREPYLTSQRLRFGLTSGAARLRERAAAIRQAGEGRTDG